MRVNLEEAYHYLEINLYKEWYALVIVHYGALYLRMETYYLIAFGE